MGKPTKLVRGASTGTSYHGHGRPTSMGHTLAQGAAVAHAAHLARKPRATHIVRRAAPGGSSEHMALAGKLSVLSVRAGRGRHQSMAGPAMASALRRGKPHIRKGQTAPGNAAVWDEVPWNQAVVHHPHAHAPPGGAGQKSAAFVTEVRDLSDDELSWGDDAEYGFVERNDSPHGGHHHLEPELGRLDLLGERQEDHLEREAMILNLKDPWGLPANDPNSVAFWVKRASEVDVRTIPGHLLELQRLAKATSIHEAAVGLRVAETHAMLKRLVLAFMGWSKLFCMTKAERIHSSAALIRATADQEEYEQEAALQLLLRTVFDHWCLSRDGAAQKPIKAKWQLNKNVSDMVVAESEAAATMPGAVPESVKARKCIKEFALRQYIGAVLTERSMERPWELGAVLAKQSAIDKTKLGIQVPSHVVKRQRPRSPAKVVAQRQRPQTAGAPTSPRGGRHPLAPPAAAARPATATQPRGFREILGAQDVQGDGPGGRFFTPGGRHMAAARAPPVSPVRTTLPEMRDAAADADAATGAAADAAPPGTPSATPGAASAAAATAAAPPRAETSLFTAAGPALPPAAPLPQQGAAEAAPRALGVAADAAAQDEGPPAPPADALSDTARERNIGDFAAKFKQLRLEHLQAEQQKRSALSLQSANRPQHQQHQQQASPAARAGTRSPSPLLEQPPWEASGAMSATPPWVRVGDASPDIAPAPAPAPRRCAPSRPGSAPPRSNRRKKAGQFGGRIIMGAAPKRASSGGRRPPAQRPLSAAAGGGPPPRPGPMVPRPKAKARRPPSEAERILAYVHHGVSIN